MTSPRQAEANRRNALSSTGPRTAIGKATVARNAVRHGAFAALPVIPDVERPEDWEAHRAGIVQCLAPVGPLETRLAERVALLLWRLDRVTRYETAAIAVGREEVTDEPAPEPTTPTPDAETDTSRLAKRQARLAKRRQALAEAESRLALLGRLPGLADGEPLSWDEAFGVLDAAYGMLPEEAPAPWIEDTPFLQALGLPADADADEVNWTAGLVRRGLALLAKMGRTSVEKLTQRATRSVEEDRADAAAKVETLAAKVKAQQRRRRTLTERALARRTLPDEGAEAKVLRYEAHLNRQLFQTLHELERMQASRSGLPVPVPAAVDVAVDLSGAAPAAGDR
jgi:hypothetical protein